MERVKIAFVGCGAISHLHLKAIHSNNNLIFVTAAIDPNPDHLSKIQSLCSSFIPPSSSSSSPSNPPLALFLSLDEAIEANSKAIQETGKWKYTKRKNKMKRRPKRKKRKKKRKKEWEEKEKEKLIY